MTRDTARPGEGSTSQVMNEAEILAALWEEAPFARLPRDAPSELKKFVVDIENPKRVYAIHRASRRHNFQTLVELFVIQLRDGCGLHSCPTSTCFSCRKRMAGKAPIRRYNTTSARTLAVYLASQDNPETWLCPNLRPPKTPPAALRSLVFSPNLPKQPTGNGSAHGSRQKREGGRAGPVKESPQATKPAGKTSSQPPSAGKPTPKAGGDTPEKDGDEAGKPATPSFTVHERTVRKDYRSFAGNMFGTVAFKMLEWLSPNGLDAMSQKVGDIEEDAALSGQPKPQLKTRQPSTESIDSLKANPEPEKPADAPMANGSRSEGGEKNGPQPLAPSQQPRSGGSQPNVARPRASSASKPRRQMSIDPFPPAPNADEVLAGLGSPRVTGLPADGIKKGLKPQLARRLSQIPTSNFFGPISTDNMTPPATVAIMHEVDQDNADAQSPPPTATAEPTEPSSGGAPSAGDKLESPKAEPVVEANIEHFLPQSLSELNLEIVDLLCDILQEDGTQEVHMLEPPTVSARSKRSASRGRRLRRRPKSQPVYSQAMKQQWKLFIEQSFFNILSDPHAIIRSFSTKNGLFDSQTLWYCLLRMTRVAPSLVFDSLWMATATLFALPRSLQSLRSPTSKVFRKTEPSLSNAEAARLMSVCLHALVAAAPLVNDTRQLLDMSRIRSHGLSLSTSGAVAKQPAELCLQYDDALSDYLLLRLARRLFSAVTTRNRFDEVVEMDRELDGAIGESRVLDAVISQMDFLNSDMPSILDFSSAERVVHEKRVPILLLDWARAVMLADWDGSPEVDGDSPFGGALALIKTMYQKRQSLFLGDVHFRSEYFADRLDSIEMPVAWLTVNSTRRKLHLLDFPYIFSQQTLVSYFRSINFSRMSRSFEESSSLQSRMGAIISPGSLITDPHHKQVLQGMLRTASSKYLILNIRRNHVIKDTFDQLWRREERELMRPMKVHLGEDGGEEGFDSGGVQQEFFRLAIAEVLNPDYGAFTQDERTRMSWFQPGTLEPDWVFELTGLLMSLAVYNGLTLPVTFPKALYRKLLGEPVTDLHHIADGWPDLAQGLTTLVDWDEKDGTVEDVFARTYEFSIEVLGEPISREMGGAAASIGGSAKDSGVTPSSSSSSAAATAAVASSSETPPTPTPEWPKFAATNPDAPNPSAANPPDAPMVTGENRHAYVTDYVSYLTDVSVRRQFDALSRGFRACLHPKSLTLLTPALLQGVVEGTQDIDVSELKRYARYVGWDANHRTVRDFWSIIKRYDDDMRRKLLEFVTASDRVPVGGMKNIQFVIQRNGEQDEGGHLPTAYTCYGTLLLPVYRDKEVLRERLTMALQNAQGFGFA